MTVTINGTTGIAVPLGSVSAPGVSNTTSSTTGLYNPTGTTLGIATNGTNALYIDASQNVGIGTTSPVNKLNVFASDATVRTESTSEDKGLLLVKSGVQGFALTVNGAAQRLDISTANAWPTISQVMSITGAGNVGIGTTSPLTSLQVSGSGGTTVLVSDSGNANFRGYAITSVSSDTTQYASLKLNAATGELRHYVGPNTYGGFQTFYANGSEAMRIDLSGNLLVNTTTSRAKITVKGATSDSYTTSGIALERASVANYWNILPASTNDLYFGYNTTDKGYIRQSDGAYISLSDERTKKNVADISYGLNAVLALRPCSYNMVDQQDDDKKTLGFIAQETLQIIPESVSEMQGGMYGMDKSAVIPVLVKAIQELSAEVTALKAKVGA